LLKQLYNIRNNDATLAKWSRVNIGMLKLHGGRRDAMHEKEAQPISFS